MPTELVDFCHNLKKQNQVEFFLSTGRNMNELGHIISKFRNLFSYVSTENGGIVFDQHKNEKIYPSGQKPDEKLTELIDSVLKNYGHLIVKDRNKETIWSAEFEQNLDVVFQHCKNLIAERQLDITVYHHGNYNGTIDIVPNSINKVNILKILPSFHQVYFFGDSENDFELLAHEHVKAGTVENAKPRILQLVREKNGNGFVSNQKCGLGVLDGLIHFSKGMS